MSTQLPHGAGGGRASVASGAARPRNPGPAAAAGSSTLVYLHLLALATLAWAQPLFEQLTRHAGFFAARGGGRADVLLVVALAMLAPPVPWLVAAWTARRWLRGPAARRVEAGLVGSLGGLIVLRGLALAAAPPLAAVASTVTATVVCGWLYRRAASARSFATLLVPAVVVVPALFLLDPNLAGPLARRGGTPPLHASGATMPVVVLILDELPLAAMLDDNGRIDRWRLPHLAAFAAEATWFPAAVAPSADTATAVPALMSGWIAAAGDPLQRERNLCTLLGDYPVYVAETFSHTCSDEVNRLALQRRPPWRRRALQLTADLPVVAAQLLTPPGWRRHLPAISFGWEGFADAGGPVTRWPGQRPGPYGRRRGLTLFRNAIAPAERALYVGHLILPHMPWDHLPSGRTYPSEPDRFFSLALEPNRWRLAQLYQRFALQLGYTDRVVGDLFARLRRAGLYDRALVVVVADHGGAFRPGVHRRQLTEGTLAEVLSVPLLVKRPGQRKAAVVTTPVSTSQLLPTVASVLGVDPPWPLASPSLLAPGPQPRPHYLDAAGELVPAPLDLPARTLAARDWLRELAGDAGSRDPFAIGPHPELHGLPAPAGDPPPGAHRVTLDHPGRYRDVDPAAAEVPVFVGGAVTGASEGDGCCTLAVAMGGTVWATTGSFWTADGRHRFGALVPEAALRPGDQQVAVYRVDRAPGGALALRRLALD